MGLNFAQIWVLLGLKKDDFDKGMKETEKSTKSLGDKFDDLSSVAKAALTTGVVGGAVAAGKAIYEMSKQGAAVIQTAESFDFLSQKLGLPRDLLEELRRASNGTIDDMTLMSSTATLLAGTTDELGAALGNATPQLMEIAKAANKLNPSLGTTSHMYESIALGIKRASPMILDNLGLTIKIGDANEEMAKKLGKSVEALTAEEKQMALLEATLKAGDNLIAQVGGTTDSATDSFYQFETNVTNLKNELMTGLAPAVASVTGAIAELFHEMNNATYAHDEFQKAVDDGIITQQEMNVMLGVGTRHAIDYDAALEKLWATEEQRI